MYIYIYNLHTHLYTYNYMLDFVEIRQIFKGIFDKYLNSVYQTDISC